MNTLNNSAASRDLDAHHAAKKQQAGTNGKPYRMRIGWLLWYPDVYRITAPSNAIDAQNSDRRKLLRNARMNPSTPAIIHSQLTNCERVYRIRKKESR